MELDRDWYLRRSGRLLRLRPVLDVGDSMKVAKERVGLEASHEKHRGRGWRDHRQGNG